MSTNVEEKSEQSVNCSLEYNVAVSLLKSRAGCHHGPGWQLYGVFGLSVCDGACYCASFSVYIKCYCSNLLIVATHAWSMCTREQAARSDRQWELWLDAPQRSQRMTEPRRIGQGRSWNVEGLVTTFQLEERTEGRRALPEAGGNLFWGYTAPEKGRQKFFV